MQELSKNEHDFGHVIYNSTHCTQIKYNGDLKLTRANFIIPCVCTSFHYDAESKFINVCLQMDSIPVKEVTIILNKETGQELLKLKATVATT